MPAEDPETMELEALEPPHGSDRFESIPRFPAVAEDLSSEALEDEEEEIEPEELTATQTRPHVILPKRAPTAKASDPWVVRAESLLDAIERTPDRVRRVALHRDLARLLIENREPGQAFEVLVSALAEDINDDQTVEALEREVKTHDRLGDLLRTALAWSEDIEWMRDPPRLGALLLRIAKWYGEDVKKVEWGMPFAIRARRLLPDHDARPHRMLARLYRRDGKLEQAESALEAALARARAPELRADLLLERGRVREDRGDDPAAVREMFSAALDADPTSEAAITALDTGPDEERIAAWEKRVAALRAPAALEASRMKLAELLQQARHDTRAAAILEDVILAEPEHRKALEALARVRHRLRDWLGLRATLEHAVEITVGRERVAILQELSTLLVDSFSDHDAAIGRLEQALELDSTNEAVHQKLALLHELRGRKHDLARVLERHAGTVTERRKRAALSMRAARILADDLGDRPAALQLVERTVAFAPDDAEALDLLSQLLQQLGHNAAADEAIERALAHNKDPERRSQLTYRRALLRKMAGADPAEIRELLQATVDARPDHLGALDELRALSRAEGDPAAAARACVRELETTEAPARRVTLLLELARLRATELEDLNGALESWDEVLHIKPGNAEAAAAVIEPYAERGRWPEVHRLASVLLSSGIGEQATRAKWHALHGRALKMLGHAAEASKALAEAVRLDAGDVNALEALAETRFAADDWEGAFAADTRLLGMLDPGEHERLLALHHRMGCVQDERGRTRGALASFEQALAIDPEHRPTLERLALVHAGRRAWPEVVECKRRLLEATVNVDERIALLIAIADVWSREANKPQAAVEALEEALDQRPRDLSLMHRLLEAYQRVDAWANMADVLARIADIDRVPAHRAKYFYTLGQVHRDKRHDNAAATQAFEKALDEDPSQLKAFEAVVRLHTIDKAWKSLERAYRRMLHRVSGQASPELELELWNGLGLVYRDRLRDSQSAVEAFKMASRARPEDARVRRILAELHASTGKIDDAAAELHTAIAQHPLHAEPYRALFRLYRDAQRVDRAWCLAAALVLLEKADDEIQSFHARWQRRTAPAFRGRIDAPTFTRVICHPDEDVLVAKIFEIILPAIRLSRATNMRASIAPPPDVRWEERETAKTLLARAFFGAADVLRIPAPRLALRPDREGFLIAVGTEPPATVAGRGALSLTRPEEVLFLVGQHLSSWRGDAHLRVLFPATRALESLLVAALKLAQPQLPLPERAADDARMIAQHLQPVELESLRMVVKRFLADRGQADLKLWARGLELTAARAGLLLCGDLATAVRGFDSVRLDALGIPASEVVRDLVAWFVSPEHLELRERIGIALGPRQMPT